MAPDGSSSSWPTWVVKAHTQWFLCGFLTCWRGVLFTDESRFSPAEGRQACVGTCGWAVCRHQIRGLSVAQGGGGVMVWPGLSVTLPQVCYHKCILLMAFLMYRDLMTRPWGSLFLPFIHTEMGAKTKALHLYFCSNFPKLFIMHQNLVQSIFSKA